MFAYNLIVLLLFISHSRAVFSDPGIVPLPSHPIDFSDAHQQSSNGTKGKKHDNSSIPSGLMTNQTPPDEGNDRNHILHLKQTIKLSLIPIYRSANKIVFINL